MRKNNSMKRSLSYLGYWHWLSFLGIFFLSIYPYSSDTKLRSLCSRAFFSKETSSFFIAGEFNNPVSKTIIEGYETAKRLQLFDNKKQIREFEKGLKDMLEFLEHTHAHKEQMILSKLDVSLEASVNKVPEIMEFVQGLQPGEALYFKKIAQAVLAIFSKHIPVMLKEDISQADWPRMNLILKNVVAFDMQNPRFSLYKIKRAIEGRYSLKEFILCRT